MDDTDQLDATALAAAIRDGELTVREAVELAFRRIDERDPVINAVCAVHDADRVLEDVDRDPPSGPLAGVPFVVKDLGASIRGLPATSGCRLMADVVADADSEIVARYRRGGLVPIAMTNTPELGRNASTEPLLHGPTRNPHRLTHSAGGSSGGTAAAVAAGIVPAGHGNDGGGSIRIPASACGLVGLKPSRGRTPARPRRTAFAYPLGVNHVLTRSVRDTALLLDLTAGAVPGDPYVIAPPARPYVEEVGAPPGRLRVALSTVTPNGAATHPACALAATSTAALLADLGHDVVEAAPDHPLDALSAVMRVCMVAPLAAEVDQRLAELGRGLHDDDLEPFTRVLYDLGRGLSGTDVVVALQELERVAAVVGCFFVDHDVLLTPTIAQPVPPLGHLDTTDVEAMFTRAATYSSMTSPFNATGQPAISLPAGTDENGLPLGVQLVAAFGREDLLIRVASQLEVARPWATKAVWPPRNGPGDGPRGAD